MVVMTRFIPTYVGNTIFHCKIYARIPVHPHVCGEHNYDKNGNVITDGSSPRMWGTRFADMTGMQADRFIPTYVGNTAARISSFIGSPVHPHVCGEHRCIIELTLHSDGSSPRMWGTLMSLNKSMGG